MTTLRLKVQSNFPIEAGAITPDNFIGKTEAEISGLPFLFGKEKLKLGDVFSVEGDGSSELVLEGDLWRVKHIGAEMTQGKVVVHSSVGMHLGSDMHGGEIEVFGDAGDWAGAEMKGGKIRIHGNAGNGLGAAYRGSRHGMNRGLIIVDGNAGNEIGSVMRRGLIVVGGDVAEYTGEFMLAGTIIVFGNMGARAGASMKYGSIIAFYRPEFLPTYHYDCVYSPIFLKLILQSLKGQAVAIDPGWINGDYRRYSGDANSLGKGEILVYDQH
ncbi:MAG: formylmethanofuran dehydrogenase subunit C [Anaerolineaceae bacterium]|nr:formylmethanofuran dehydrogenase subunit C [Anaerolineaceae bacterium]